MKVLRSGMTDWMVTSPPSLVPLFWKQVSWLSTSLLVTGTIYVSKRIHGVPRAGVVRASEQDADLVVHAILILVGEVDVDILAVVVL